MRTVIVGTDFVYDKDGNLKPIEINTATGWQYTTIEDDSSKINLSYLQNFINSNGFTKVVYIGNLMPISESLTNLCQTLSLEYEEFFTAPNSITVPYVEDNNQTLIIRSSYDTTAIVDDTYCSNKVNFLNLIKNTQIGSQFAYVNNEGQLVNNITTINDNGDHPNFILKCVSPDYDKQEYPKLYKVTNQSELNVVLQNVNSEYFLMEYHFNPNKLYEGNQMVTYRSFNLLYPPSLESIEIAGYTTLSSQKLNTTSTFDSETYELNDGRNKYISTEVFIDSPKLLDTDKVEMADGTFKTPLEFEIGDYVKTIDIPNPNNIDLTIETGDFQITWDEFVSGTTFSTNRITNKRKIDKLVNYVKITFTDGSFWEDIEGSSYLINRNNNLRFAFLGTEDHVVSAAEIVNPGDKIVLVDTTNEEFTPIEKEVLNIVIEKTVFSGWIISVERKHIFLTQTSDNTSFVAIEHNVACTVSQNTNCEQGFCAKGFYCTNTLNYPCGGKNCNCKTSCFVPKI